MDVTPHDLRNAELREAFRGYRPDEVEELLERAAASLERLHERNRQLQERLAEVEEEASSSREMEAALRQTLLLAQRTADETMATANEKARELVEEAEDKSLTMLTEAEETARVTGEAQRHKYNAIVAELSARRDLLVVDIDALERVQSDYRSRLRAVLEAELAELDRRATLPPPTHPDLHEIDLGPAGMEDMMTGSPDFVPTGQDEIDIDDGGPPTEAMVVIEEEMAESGQSNASRRRG